MKDEAYVQWEGGDDVADWRCNYTGWMKDNVKKANVLSDHRIDGKEDKNRTDGKKCKSKVEPSSSFIRMKESLLEK